MKRIKNLFKKSTLSVMMVFSLVVPTLSGIVIPQPVQAQAAVVELESIPETRQEIFQRIKETLAQAANVAVKNSIRSFLERLAYDWAVFLASGGVNQEPVVWAETVQSSITAAGDAATGEFLNTLVTENGWLSLNLCNLPSIDQLRINLILPKLLAPEPSACTYSAIRKEFIEANQGLRQKFETLRQDPDALIIISASVAGGDNALAATLTAWDAAIGAREEAEQANQIERIKSDFRDLTGQISGTVETPAGIIEAQTNVVLDDASEAETTLTGNPFADALSVFYTTLASKLLERFTTGLLNGLNTPSIADSLSGNSSTAFGTGIEAAQQQFAEFRSASFIRGSQIDILTEFAACPDDAIQTTNCVINEPLRLAIEEGMSLREAVWEQGIIDPSTPFALSGSRTAITNPEEGLAIRNLKVLKQYSVIPVGWVLAAEYNRDFDTTSITLGEVMDDFDNCSTDDYSPYCGLVDPDWTLKAPDVFCRFEGYGEVLTTDEFVDTDGARTTPQENILSRQLSCLDPQTCLSEDDNGSCNAYGYCTEQQDTYNIEGEECPLYYAGCDTFRNEQTNDRVSYLTNTINFNDCSADVDGCDWRCSEYNTVDEAFQCATQDTVYTTCTTDGGCGCTATSDDGSVTESCTISNGGFFCETESQLTCTLGTASATDAGEYSIPFDYDVQDCSSRDNGCTEFITLKGGENVIGNASFEYFNDFRNAADDVSGSLASMYDGGVFEDNFAYSSEDGEPCVQSAEGVHDCLGWERYNGAEVRAVSEYIHKLDERENGTALQIAETSSDAYIVHRFDTGQPLENRSFNLSFYYANPEDGGVSCTGTYWVAADSTGNAEVPSDAIEIEYTNEDGFGGAFAQYDTDTVTFAEGETTETIMVGFSAASGCNVVLDGVKLEENSGSTGFTAYQSTPSYYNINEMSSCSVDDVGCELYQPRTGESDLDVTGQITNPLSDACGGGNALTNPECSQCEEAFVGCEAYYEVPIAYDVPVNDISLFGTAPDAELASAIADRTGLYCSDDFTSCNTDSDCNTGASCLPSISIIPDTADRCTAAAVGCEEYVNLEESGESGEQLEYYSFIQQCVKPTEEQQDNGEIATYFTWEGDDISGFQLRSWDLKVSNVAEDGAFGPCTNVDLYDFGSSAETAEAECIDDTVGLDTCSEDEVGENPECLDFQDEEGNHFYRLRSDIVFASDDCQALRNSLDNRVYHALATESTSCSASQNMCREYKGSEGNRVDFIIDDDVDQDPWVGATASAVTVTANIGQSMVIGVDPNLEGASDASRTTAYYYNISDDITEENSYVIQFWAKSTDSDTLNVYLESESEGTQVFFTLDDSGQALTDDWKQYTLGPLTFGDAEWQEDMYLVMSYPGQAAYIDNVEFRRSDSFYLIAGTADFCNGYEGCEEYRAETTGSTQYLKSFTRLCSESVVGCAALIATQHSDFPFAQIFNTSNEFDNDDVKVQADEVQFYTVNSGAECSSTGAGCWLYGTPDLDASYEVTGFAQEYLINDPDRYSTDLCQQQQLQCEAWEATDGDSVLYFKDPGEKYCTYDSANGKWVTSEGDDCPVQNDNIEPSQPKGSVCNGGLREGDLCTADTECPAAEDDSATYRCVSTQSDSGWVGQCADTYAGCTLYVDPYTDSDVDNGTFESDYFDNDNAASKESDGVPDGWDVWTQSRVDKRTIAAAPLRARISGVLEAAGVITPVAAADYTALEYDDITNYENFSGLGIENEVVGGSTYYRFGYINFYTESDWYGSRSIGDLSLQYKEGDSSATRTDNDSGNPSSAEPMLIAVWTTYSQPLNPMTLTVDFDNGSDSDSVDITLPTLTPDSSNTTNWWFFYVDIDGNLYQATDATGPFSGGSASSSSYSFMSADDALVDEYAVDSNGELVGEAVDETETEEEEEPSEEIITPEANGYADTLGIAAENIGCDTAQQSNALSDVVNGRYAFELGLNSAGDTAYELCMVSTEETYQVDINALYTLSGYTYSQTLDSNYSIGLQFFDESRQELGVADASPERFAFAAFEGEERSNESVPSGQWNYFHATIGPNLETEFPVGTAYVRPFIAVDTPGTSVYFDEIRFSANDVYSYVDSTVDGSGASGENTCNGTVNPEQGCVALREVTKNSLSYLSQQTIANELSEDFSLATCTFNSANPDEACQSRPNTADANIVAKVRENRECAEWLACRTAAVDLNENGEIENVACQEIGRCTKRNPDTGVCTNWVTGLDADNVGYDDDLSATSAPGNTIDLEGIENISGFATAGIEWDTDGNGVTDAVVYGYYPYDWMPERGLGTASTSEELIPYGDFEAVYCAGSSENDIANGIERQRDKALSCTFDYQCRTLETDNAAESAFAEEDSSADIDESDYHLGWCENVSTPRFGTGLTWRDWATRGDSEMMIVDYEETEFQPIINSRNINSFTTAFATGYETAEDEKVGENFGAGRADLDNVLYVKPATAEEGGAEVEIPKSSYIEDAEEYTLSFDARYVEGSPDEDDVIQVGIEHENGTINYFETGSAALDVVFLVSSTTNTTSILQDLADQVETWDEELDSQGVSTEYSIVTVGQADGPHVVDFDDFTSSNFNGGSITDGTTDSGIAVGAALEHIADNTPGFYLHTYEALDQIASGEYVNDGYSYSGRSGARKAVVMVMPNIPQNYDVLSAGVADDFAASFNSENWDYDDELDFIDYIGDEYGAPYRVYTIVENSAKSNSPSESNIPSDAYDNITEQFGGEMYESTDTTALNLIGDALETVSTEFKFTNKMQRYVLGPISISGKVNKAESSTLFISQGNADSLEGDFALIDPGPAFVIDDVSLKPVLEVSKEGNPANTDDAHLIARTCRGYPADDSPDCDYTEEDSGIIYTGWHGYCLEHDEWNEDQCLAWWPVDVIASERDSITSKTDISYTQTDVYHCIVAKGNQNLGACEDTGLMCLVDGDCGSGGNCLAGSESASDSYTQSGDTLLTQNVRSFNYQHEVILDPLDLDPDDDGNGVFMRYEPTPVEDLIHVSEIDSIGFFMGEGTDCAWSTPDQDESKRCTDTARLSDGSNAFVSGKVNLNLYELEQDPDDAYALFKSGSEVVTAGAQEGGSKGNVYYGYQQGVWCDEEESDESGLCNPEDLSQSDVEDLNLYFVKGNYSSSSATNQEHNGGTPKNPFGFARLQPDGNLWDNNGIEGTETEIRSAKGIGTSSSLYNYIYGDAHNAFGVNFNFESGYLEGVYMYYVDQYGPANTETLENIQWTYYLKEPCLLAVQSSDESANATPWVTRVTSGSDYSVPALTYTYDMDDANVPYGAIGNSSSDGDATPEDIDGYTTFEDSVEDGVTTAGGALKVQDITSIGENVPGVMREYGAGATQAYACIGQCQRAVCSVDYNITYDGVTECTNSSTGFSGVFHGIGQTNSGVHNGAGTDSSYDSYLEQLQAAAQAGWNYYRLLFADTGRDVWYVGSYGPRVDLGNGLESSETAVTGLTITDFFNEDGDDLYDFDDADTLDICRRDGRFLALGERETRGDSEYCGLRPEIDSIRINGATEGEIELDHGDTLSLGFNSDVDPDQEPLNIIRIAWEGVTGQDFSDDDYFEDAWEAASTNNHYYTHVMECDLTDSDAPYVSSSETSSITGQAGRNACEYQVKVQVQDAWGFCSGESNTDVYRDQEDDCTSYDAYNGVIYVYP